MEKIIATLEKIKEINNTYHLSNEKADVLLSEMEEAKVCVPIIGKFSSGKSALVNTLLGYRRGILRQDITPETALPAEIIYTEAEECVVVKKNDGTEEQLPVEAYREYQADIRTARCARIFLHNSFLEKIPDVMLVDMPGFESGLEIHDRAIDDYLPQSLAYIVTFPADNLIVCSSVGNILKELCLHDMPLCVAVTKYDKRDDDFKITFEKMKESLKRYVGNREIRYCLTSSFDCDVEELEDFLKEIQECSQELLSKKFLPEILVFAETTENYLKATLNGNQLSESEFEEREEKINSQLSEMCIKFEKEQSSFELEMAESIEEIKNDVRSALEFETLSIVILALNGQNINEYLNLIVRNAVTVSIKKRFIPRMDKYMKRVASTLNGESFGDVHLSFYYDVEGLDKSITSSVVAVAAGILLGLPILGIIAGVILKICGDKKREEAKRKIREKLENEVYPQILQEVGGGIEQAVTKHTQLLNESIEEKMKNQKETLEKAMEDVRAKRQEEKTLQEKLADGIKADLERLSELKNGL